MKNVANESIILSACGATWHFERPGNLEERWAALETEEFNRDERIPYWLELWPASVALGQWLCKNVSRIKDKKCIEMGCGLGFSALVAASLGAHVLAFDYEKEAVSYARHNARINNLAPHPLLLFCVADWRQQAMRSKSAACIWGADIIYEKRFIEPVTTFLDRHLEPGGTVWIAEPGRSVYNDFRKKTVEAGWLATLADTLPAPIPGRPGCQNRIQLWEFTRPA